MKQALTKSFLFWSVMLIVFPWSLLVRPIRDLVPGWGMGSRLTWTVMIYFSGPAELIGAPLFKKGEWGLWVPVGPEGWTLIFIFHALIATIVAVTTVFVYRKWLLKKNEPA